MPISVHRFEQKNLSPPHLSIFQTAEVGSVYSHTITNSCCSNLGRCGGFVMRLTWAAAHIGKLWADMLTWGNSHGAILCLCGAGLQQPGGRNSNQNTAFLMEEKYRTGHLTKRDSKGIRAATETPRWVGLALRPGAHWRREIRRPPARGAARPGPAQPSRSASRRDTGGKSEREAAGAALSPPRPAPLGLSGLGAMAPGRLLTARDDFWLVPSILISNWACTLLWH